MKLDIENYDFIVFDLDEMDCDIRYEPFNQLLIYKR